MSDVSVVYNHFPEYLSGLELALAVGLDRGLAPIEDEAKSTAPVLSGALAASGYRQTPVYDDRSQAVAEMSSLNPDATATDALTRQTAEGVVGFAADYAPYVHDGHHTRSGSFVPGQPFLTQAWEAHREELVQSMADAMIALADTLSIP